MLAWIDKFLFWKKERSQVWRFVGTVTGETRVVRDGQRVTGATYVEAYTLLESEDGRFRKVKISGHAAPGGRSPHAVLVKANVEAWLHGGPLPQAVKIREPEPPRKKADLVVFRGGKKDAGSQEDAR